MCNFSKIARLVLFFLVSHFAGYQVPVEAGLSSLQGTTLLTVVLPFALARRHGKGNSEKVEANDHKIIDEILKKGEIEKAKQKEQQKQTASSDNGEKNGELDPVKCFPKALCGVSSEVEQISKRKKNGLVTEYLILMKAVARHPEFLDDAISTPGNPTGKKKKGKKPTKSDPQDDLTSDNDGSDSEEDDLEESDEEEEDQDEEDEPENDHQSPGNTNKKPQHKDEDEEFHKAYLKEKLEMDKLLKETMQQEGQNQYPVDPSSWDVNNGPLRPGVSVPVPWRRRPPPQQKPTRRPWGFAGLGGGYGSQPPQPSNPYYRLEEPLQQEEGGSSGSGPFFAVREGFSGISSFFRNLFGFGETSLTNDPWFSAAARDLGGEISPGIAVTETREILETALDVGKSFERPSQCNEIFNACPYEYTELLYIIDDLRKNVRASVKERTTEGGAIDNRRKKTGIDKSEISSKNAKQKKSKSGKKKKKATKSSKLSDSMSEPYYVSIPVTPPPPSKLSGTFSNVLSWLGLNNGY